MPLHHSRRLARGLAATALLLLAALFARAATTEHVSLAGIAHELALEYRDMSAGAVRAAKLVGKGHEFIFCEGLPSVRADGQTRALAESVRWNGSELLVSRDAADLITKILGAPPTIPSGTLVRSQRAPIRKRLKVVLDPGHGGKDPGAMYGGLEEKAVNLDIALRVGAYLENRDIRVVFTRKSDLDLDLNERVAIANREAPDLFVSLHANADRQSGMTGAMTLYPPMGERDGKPDLDGRAVAQVDRKALQPKDFGAAGPVSNDVMHVVARTAFESFRWMSKDCAREIQRQLAPLAGTVRSDGVTEDWRGLRVLSTTHAPAVLVEVDFLSNPTRRRKLSTVAYRAALAARIGEAIANFLEKNSNGDSAL